MRIARIYKKTIALAFKGQCDGKKESSNEAKIKNQKTDSPFSMPLKSKMSSSHLLEIFKIYPRIIRWTQMSPSCS